MSDDGRGTVHDRWARLRFAIIGPLLAAPPRRGELSSELKKLASKRWKHPVTGEPVSFEVPTLERWYYLARGEMRDPIKALRKKIRKDAGTHRAMGDTLRSVLRALYRDHPSWSYQLHADNLAVVCEEKPALGESPSYATVFRYMKSQGMFKQRRPVNANRPGAERARERLASYEVRSYELEHVHALWHTDFHHGSRKVLLPNGVWTKVVLFGMLDDRSRLVCHAQWYLEESAETFCHGLWQGFQKRGLPRGLLSDNGKPMLAAETTEGLAALSIVHETTLAYSPYQNAKQEIFWAQIEGRLFPMLEGVRDLSLALLNEATQAWVEREYNRKIHQETGQTPIARALAGPSVGRESPSSDTLRKAFRRRIERTQRRCDGTLSLEGIRFEIPSRYRHFERVTLRYATWDLGHVDLIDPRTEKILCPLYPLDKVRNADGQRRALEPIAPAELPAAPKPAGMAPLLRKLMADYAATGLPPAYLPKGTSHASSDDDIEADE
jgi:transposase InsO family protein